MKHGPTLGVWGLGGGAVQTSNRRRRWPGDSSFDRARRFLVRVSRGHSPPPVPDLDPSMVMIGRTVTPGDFMSISRKEMPA